LKAVIIPLYIGVGHSPLLWDGMKIFVSKRTSVTHKEIFTLSVVIELMIVVCSTMLPTRRIYVDTAILTHPCQHVSTRENDEMVKWGK